jgi:glycerophosphoryl diester phosphodiesterase
MKILSHRGYWKNESEKNTKTAFIRSFDFGFGTEIDVRDLNGCLVISHDPPTGGEMLFHDFLLLCPYGVTIAINIKSDGLAYKIQEILKSFKNLDCFVFDMSIPDMRIHLNIRNSTFARLSEVEQTVPWVDECDGIWLDSFNSVWFDANFIDYYLKLGKKVCVVSSELHNCDNSFLWNMLKSRSKYNTENGLFLCTDYPEAARNYFLVNNL